MLFSYKKVVGNVNINEYPYYPKNEIVVVSDEVRMNNLHCQLRISYYSY